MGNYTIFTCSKFLGEAGKQEILEPKVPNILDLKSNLVPRAFPLIFLGKNTGDEVVWNRLPNRYFPKIDVALILKE